MELKPDIGFRASDGQDPDRVRADIELLNQRMTVLADNIRTLAEAMGNATPEPATVVQEVLPLAPGGGLVDSGDGVRLDVNGLPIGPVGGGWFLVQTDDGELFRVPSASFVNKPALNNPDDVPTLAAYEHVFPPGANFTWPGNGSSATKDELYQVAVATDREMDKLRAVLNPILDIIRNIGTDGTS